MSNNNQINSDRLVCTINTVDNGSTFSKDGNLVWYRLNLGHKTFYKELTVSAYTG